MPNDKILSNIADNPDLYAAVKDLFLKQFSIDELKYEVSDELLGQAVRARLVGIKAVEHACAEIMKHKTVKLSPQSENPAF